MTRPIQMDPDYYRRHLLYPVTEQSNEGYDRVCLDAAVRELQDAEDALILKELNRMTTK